MTARFTLPLMVLLVIVGGLLLCNGMFHAVLYLVDDKPVMSGLRYLNWISVFLGVALLYIGFTRLVRM